MSTPHSFVPESFEAAVFSFAEWRLKFLKIILRGACVLGLLVMIAGSLDAPAVLAALYTGAYLAVLILTFAPFSYRVRAIGILLVVYVLAISSLLETGIRVDARLFFMTLTIVATMLYGLRGGVMAAVGGLVTIGVAGFFILTGRYTIISTTEPVGNLWNWLVTVSVLPMLETICVIGLVLLQREFDMALQQSRRLFDVVQAERALLEQRIAARTAEAAQHSEELAHRSQELEALNQQLIATSQHAERRAAQLATSAQVARAISQVRNLEELLTQVTGLIGTAFDFYHVGIFIIDDAGRYAVLHAANSAGGQAMLARGHRLAVGHEGMVGYVTQTGLPRIALDAGADAVHFDNPDLPDTHSEMTLPLQVGGRVLGALDLQTTQAAAFSDEDLAALGMLADQVAVAIVNARLFEQARQAMDELNALNRRLTGETWQADRPGKTLYYERRRSSGDASEPPGLVRRVPIELRGAPIGTITLEDAPARTFSADEQTLIDGVARQLALALENQRLTDVAQQAAQRDRAIASTADKIHQPTDLDAILRVAVDELSRITGIDGVGVQLGFAPTPGGRGNGHGHDADAGPDLTGLENP